MNKILVCICTVILCMVSLAAIFCYTIMPDNTPNANEMNLALVTKPPGFEMTFIDLNTTRKNKQSILDFLIHGSKQVRQWMPITNYHFTQNELHLVEYVGDEIIGPKKIIPLHKFKKNTDLIKKEHIIHKRFWLGTDKYGRDLLSRLIVGSRVSLIVGIIAVLISLIIGVSLGTIAGYYGGIIDRIIMWLVNVIWTIPTLLMVIAISLALGKGFWQMFIAIGFTMWVEVARIVRGQVLSIKEKDYIKVNKLLGLNDFHIILKHIIPNILGSIIVISTVNFASAILIESGLSFLGIGVQAPTSSWGGMIKENYSYIILNKAYLSIIPGLTIILLVLSFMLLGNYLRDRMDIKNI